MEQLMDMEGLNEEVGNQVRNIAQQQVQTQTQIQTQLNKLESKSGLMKKLFGPDYKAIKNLKQQMEQNQLRVQQLEQLQTQVVNQADEIQLEEAVQALVEQNTALEEQIQAEEQVGSLFGWLIKLFIK
jgi:Cu/Ag efflux pump CusA